MLSSHIWMFRYLRSMRLKFIGNSSFKEIPSSLFDSIFLASLRNFRIASLISKWTRERSSSEMTDRLFSWALRILWISDTNRANTKFKQSFLYFSSVLCWLVEIIWCRLNRRWYCRYSWLIFKIMVQNTFVRIAPNMPDNIRMHLFWIPDDFRPPNQRIDDEDSWLM